MDFFDIDSFYEEQIFGIENTFLFIVSNLVFFSLKM